MLALTICYLSTEGCHVMHTKIYKHDQSNVVQKCTAFYISFYTLNKIDMNLEGLPSCTPIAAVYFIFNTLYNKPAYLESLYKNQKYCLCYKKKRHLLIHWCLYFLILKSNWDIEILSATLNTMVLFRGNLCFY